VLPAPSARTLFQGVTSEEAAEAAAALIIDAEIYELDDPNYRSGGGGGASDPLSGARLAAAEARRAVHEEAARLGIILGVAPAGTFGGVGNMAAAPATSYTGGASGGIPIDPAALASAADRQLAAELATVCALVEREEARRTELGAEEAGSGRLGLGGNPVGESVIAELQATQRRWEGAMQVQLQRLRRAAHEAEERNTATAAVDERSRGSSGASRSGGGGGGGRPGGKGGPPNVKSSGRSGGHSAEDVAARDAREAVVAARLSYLHERVGAMLLAERDRHGQPNNNLEGGRHTSSARDGDTKQSSRSTCMLPWGSGPGIHRSPIQGKTQRADAGVSGVLTELERGVNALAAAAGDGAGGSKPSAAYPDFRGVPVSIEALAEVKSLRNMVQAVQIELGGLTSRIEAVDQRSTGAGRAEADMVRTPAFRHGVMITARHAPTGSGCSWSNPIMCLSVRHVCHKFPI
jgi:hypothetical protein